MLVNPKFLNASFPIATTCLPFILLGITTFSPPSILYPVITTVFPVSTVNPASS